MTAEKYNKEIKELFDKWKNKPEKCGINHKDNVFVKDGIIDPEIWFDSEVRPLFLLKEAYGWENDADLVSDYLKKEDKKLGLTWRRVSQWTYGILNTSIEKLPVFKKSAEYSDGNNVWLKRIAVMNIKKSNGKKTSDSADIYAYASNDREELLEQLKIFDPTVIVCGYTYEYLELITGESIKKDQGNNENWYYYMEINNHPVIVLDYYHPANEYPDLLNFYGLVNIYQQALKNNSENN